MEFLNNYWLNAFLFKEDQTSVLPELASLGL